jgi:hypothetical protein
MPHLARLSLRGTTVTDAGMVHMEGVRKLEYLDVTDTAVTEARAIQLCKRMNLRGIGVGSSKGPPAEVWDCLPEPDDGRPKSKK